MHILAQRRMLRREQNLATVHDEPPILPRASLPSVGFGCKVGALRAHDAEALAARRLHHPPGAYFFYAPRAVLLEPRHLSLDVVGLNIKVHAAFMRNLLHFDVQTICARVEDPVRRLRFRLHRQSERRAPKLRRGIELRSAAVNDETCETAFVHDNVPVLNLPDGSPALYCSACSYVQP